LASDWFDYVELSLFAYARIRTLVPLHLNGFPIKFVSSKVKLKYCPSKILLTNFVGVQGGEQMRGI
jgi:hypothetical protein